MIQLNTILTLVKEYNLMVVLPLVIMVWYHMRWDKIVSNVRIEMRAGFKSLTKDIAEDRERLDDHETRIRQTERELLLFGKGSEDIEQN